ncbi:MAG: chemotaxis protein CheA [Erythrobacter sp.]|jgi:two-component system chemotaxis sensor kinase CheA|nr:chemotaxis protein CheA [Erythrobacter sp.]
MDDLLADFVAETREMLEASEGELIAWEADPGDRSHIDSIFRFVHTVKGNCGFFDFPRLEKLSHAAEDALSDCRSGHREPDSALVSAVLAIIDRISEMVNAIEAGEDLGEGDDAALIASLEVGAAALVVEGPPAGAGTNGEPEATEPGDEDQGHAGKADAPTILRSIRLPVDLLDRVMSGVSDMVLARNDLAHRLRQAGNQPTIDGPFERLTTILADVRDAITRMRMQRIETLFGALPRLVRDLSGELGKQVMVDLEGGDVELDREMIEMVRDPITHIIRNAIDHGIELPSDRLANGKREIGLLSIAARQSGNTISIVIGDDGRGLDDAKIADKALAMGLIDKAERADMTREAILQIIFRPGFSTADTVSNVSGRGVGLDVVRDNLERVGGSIKVSSTPGCGTFFTLQIPLTLTIIAGLTVEVGNQRFAIPQSYVEEIVHASARALDFTCVGETALVTFRGARVPCVMLSDVLELPGSELSESERTLVLLRLTSGDLFALAVDRIHSHGDIVVKPLAPAVMKSGFYAGSTLLDDGQPVLLLDVMNIAEAYELVSDARLRMQLSLHDQEEAIASPTRLMIFTDFEGRRRAVRLELVERIETAPASAIERNAAGARVVVDGTIYPLVGLPDGTLASEKVRLLRLDDKATNLLYAVREVEDAAELAGAITPVPEDPMIEGLTLIDGATIALVDGHELFARYGRPAETGVKPGVLIPEGEWAATILGPLLESAGYVIMRDAGAASDALIMFEEDFEAAQALDMRFDAPVIRLREQPTAPPGAETIYRYDRNGLFAALESVCVRKRQAA